MLRVCGRGFNLPFPTCFGAISNLPPLWECTSPFPPPTSHIFLGQTSNLRADHPQQFWSTSQLHSLTLILTTVSRVTVCAQIVLQTLADIWINGVKCRLLLHLSGLARIIDTLHNYNEHICMQTQLAYTQEHLCMPGHCIGQWVRFTSTAHPRSYTKSVRMATRVPAVGQTGQLCR